MKKHIKILAALIMAFSMIGFTAPIASAAGEGTGEVTTVEENVQSFANYDASWSNVEDCNRPFLGLTPWDCGTHYKNAWAEENIKATIVIIILNVTTDFTVLAAYLVLGFVIFGGYKILTSGGDINKNVQGRKIITNAFIGLGITMLAHIIFNVIRIGILSSPKSAGYNIGGVDVTLPAASASDLIGGMISWFVAIGGLIAVGLLIYGSILMMTSNGDPNKIRVGKAAIRDAIIGLLIVGLAEVITAFATAKINESRNVSFNAEQSLVANTSEEKGA